MLMKKNLLLFCLVLGTLSLHADEYDYLWLHGTSASATRSFALDDLRRMTFGEESMGIYLFSQSSPVAWPYANLVKITFEKEATTPIEAPVMDSDITIRCFSAEVRVESSEPLRSVCLYNAQGMLLVRFGQGDTSTSYSLRTLPSGIYIVSATNGTHTETRKFVKH